MADVKISALGAATAATGGSIPVVQSGVTKKLAMSAAGALIAEAANAAAQIAALGLAAVAASGSASDLGAGTLPIARVADAAVTNAKLANMANATVKGRNTAGTGVPEDVTMAQLKTLLALALANISDAGTVASLASDTDGAMAANSDARVPTQKAVVSYVASKIVGLLSFKGSQDCSGNPNYPVAVVGDSYIVSVAGKIGGASGTVVSVGDYYIATAINIGGTEAAVGASWSHIEHEVALAAIATTGSASDLSTGSIPAARIAAATVTLAMQANLAANSIQGNNTGSAAVPLALTIAQVSALLAGVGYTTLTPPVRSMPINIDVPEVADYTLDFALPAGCTFVSLTALIDSGTSVTASVKINSTAITGISGVTINTGSQVFTASAAKTGVLNDHIKFSISAVSGGPVKLRGSLWYTETAA